MKLTDTRAVGEWAMFRRRLITGVACLPVSLAFMVWAFVKSQPMFFMPAFMCIIAGWIMIQIAADTGTYSTNPKVREWADKVRNT